MRILQLIDTLTAGGAERMAVNISNVLADNGHEVVLCASRCGGSLEHFIDKKVIYTTLNKKNGCDPRAFVRLLKLIRKHKIELIHAHSSSVFWAAASKLFHPKLKIIWHDHNGSRIKRINKNKLYIAISPLINGFIGVNNELFKWALKNLKVKSGNIIQLNNFPYLDPIKTKVNKNNILQIVCVANLRPVKDQLTLIKAISEIRNLLPDLSFKLFLAGAYCFDDYFSQIKELIKKLDLLSIIEIVGPVDNVSELLGVSDIGVLSSISEGLPVSLLEYGLACLPVVVTNVGQCAEVVDFGNAGLVVSPSDPLALAAALLDLIQHPEKRALLGSRLKERVEKEYGAGKFLSEYNKLIESL